LVGGKLDDKEYIFAMLATLIKREGGEIRVTEDELAAVTKDDVVALLYDTRTGEIVLRLKDFKTRLTNPLNISSVMFGGNGDDDYEN
tara:strand:+ start:46 stop:306 length:261 start_codon:yes stop_codon:yes gene_type:complete